MATLLEHSPGPKKQSGMAQQWTVRPKVAVVLLIFEAALAGMMVYASSDTDDGKARMMQLSFARAAIGPNGAIIQAIEMHQSDTGHWPARLDDLITRPLGDDGNGWKGPYLKDASALLDPWDRPFQYAPPKDLADGTTRPVLWSLGLDGLDKTKDDVRPPR